MKFNKGNMIIVDKLNPHTNIKNILIINKQCPKNFNDYSNCEDYDYIEFIFCTKESKLLKTYIHKKHPIYNPHKYKKLHENIYIRKHENL